MDKLIFEKLTAKLGIYVYKKEGKDLAQLVLLKKKDGDEDITVFFKSFFQEIDKISPLTALEKALDALTDKNVAGLWFDKDVVYVVTKEEGGAWLVRKEKLVNLLKAGGSYTAVSGRLQGGDRVVVGLNEEVSGMVNKLARMRLDKIKDEDFGVLGGLFEWVNEFNEQSSDKPSPLQVPESEDGFSGNLNVPDGIDAMSEKKKITTGFKLNFDFVNKLWSMLKFHQLRLGLEKLLKGIIDKLPTQEKIYILEKQKFTDAVRSRNKKIVLGIAIVLLVGLSTSVVWQIKKKRAIEWTQKFGQTVDDLEYKIKEGQQVATLNPERARDLVDQSNVLLSTLVSRGYSDDRVQKWKKQLKNILSVASGEVSVTPQPWLNLELTRKNMVADDMEDYGDKLALIDKTEDRVVLVDIKDKSAEVLAAKNQLGEVHLLGLYDKAVYVLSDKGILKISDDVKLLFPYDDEWGSVIDMKLYSANIYLASTNGIWKYPVIDSGFGNKQPWLGDDVESIGTGTNMEIDGFVWLAEKGGHIRKFARGVEDNFVIKGMDSPFSDITDLYADENSTYLYVLETAKNRIVAIDKESGKYKKQFLSSELGNARAIVVRESDGAIYVLVGSEILKIEI